MSNSLGKYVASLLPSFEKSQIEEDVRILKETLTENTLPPFKAAKEHFDDEGFRARETKSFDTLMRRRINVDRPLQGHYIHTTFMVLQRAVENINLVESKINDNFGDDVTSGGMTYARANILRYIEVVTFCGQYARKLLLWTYYHENSAVGRPQDNPLAPADYKWLTDNQTAFIRSLSIAGKERGSLDTALRNIPDMVVVPKEADTAASVVGLNKLDPLSTGLIPIALNPIYHIRMAWTEYQVHRYNVAKEEKRALEYQLLALKEANQDRHDAKLEQQIEYTNNRIKKLNYRISKLEEE